MHTDLCHLLKYHNDTVVGYFCHHHPEFNLDEGRILFTDLLAWLWLNKQRAAAGKKTRLFGSLLVLDVLWHAFILHTRDYADFSTRYFGAFFHHDIEPIGQEYLMGEEELIDYLQDCFGYLGEEWVSRRFETALS